MIRKKNKRRLQILGLIFAVMFLVLFIRLFLLQIIRGPDYLETFSRRIQKVTQIQAQRGNIYDCSGQLIAGSRVCYNILIEASMLPEDHQHINGIIVRLLELMEAYGETLDLSLPVAVSNGRYVYDGTDDEVVQFKKDIYNLSQNDRLTAEQDSMEAGQLMEYICGSLFEIHESSSLEMSLKIAAVRYALYMKRFTEYMAVEAIADASPEFVSAVMENKSLLSGVTIEEAYERVYENSECFSHLTGYLGTVSEEELDAMTEAERAAYSSNELIGKTGLEQIYESELSGTKGEQIVYVDSTGSPLYTVRTKDAVAGNDLWLSIDKDLQIRLYQLLEERLAGILLSRLVEESDRDNNPNWLIPIEDVCTALIKNKCIDISSINADDGPNSRQLYELCLSQQERILSENVSDTDCDEDNMQTVCEALITEGTADMRTLLAVLYEQHILPMDDDYEKLTNKTISAYEFIYDKIDHMQLTADMLGLTPCSGVCIVTDVNTGKVKAMVSYPCYDSGRISEASYYSALIANASTPLYDRATRQLIAPGSTFKIVSAAIGLEEGYITPQTTVYDRVVFDKVYPPAACWSKTSHGYVNVSQALAASCNYFFYDLGFKISQLTDGSLNHPKGLHLIREYASKFGLDRKSGLEIYESAPSVSDENAVLSMIGQGTHSYTPAVLARYMTAVASRGNVYALSLTEKMCSSTGEVLWERKPKIESYVNISEKTWDTIYEGLYGVCQSSIYEDIFTSLPIKTAGKSGTAQEQQNRPDHSLFMGFAPYEDPQYCVCVIIPNGYGSANAVDLFRDAVAACFDLPLYHQEERSEGRASLPYNYSSSEEYLQQISD